MNTTRQTLFLPVDQDSGYDGKIAIDTFFVRFGDLFQAVGVFIGLNLLGWHSHQFAVLNLVLSLAWIGLAVLMGRAYVSKTQANLSHAAPSRHARPYRICCVCRAGLSVIRYRPAHSRKRIPAMCCC